MTRYTIEYGHTMEEYNEKFGTEYSNGELWDFKKIELENGAVEPQEGMVYWEIDGYLYETSN